MDRLISIMARNMAFIFVQELELKISQRARARTITWRRTRYSNNGGEISVDGDGDQRQEGAGDDGDDPETKGAAELGGVDEEFGVISKISTRGYIYPVIVGVTEWNDSVAPRCKTAGSCCNSVCPNRSNRWHRGENLD